MRFFFFIGSVRVTITLLSLAILGAIVGSLLEANTQSHLHASLLTYEHPLFRLLFWGLAANILFATFKRWPFQKKHLPFLTAHLGLLLLFGGLFVKEQFGVQGSMLLAVGKESSELSLPHSFALTLRSRENRREIPIKRTFWGSFEKTFSWPEEDLTLQWEDSLANTKERFSLSWPYPKWHHDQESGYTFGRGEPPPSLPACTLIEHPQGEQLLFYDEEGKIIHKAVAELLFSHLLALDQGFGGYYMAICPPKSDEVLFFCPLIRRIEPLEIDPIWEKNHPALVVTLHHRGTEEQVALPFQKNGGFPVSVPSGTFLLQFGEETRILPHQLLLKEARRIDYPGTNQVFSYECDLLCREEPVTITMQEPLAIDGYRYYLAALHTAPNQATLAQLTVNYDPGRYWLTYPGALLIILGTLWLGHRKLS